jgi:hypothetical protein
MAGVTVHHNIGQLAADMADIPVRASVDMRETVRDGIRLGNSLAKDFARESSGRHARKYPGTFSSEMHKTFRGFGAQIFSGEYGPAARGQGLLAPILENGSRNNKPHFNLTRSADMIGPAFAGEVRRLPDRWFW